MGGGIKERIYYFKNKVLFSEILRWQKKKSICSIRLVNIEKIMSHSKAVKSFIRN